MDIVHRLYNLNPEKLIELCRMHLCFALDLPDDEFYALMEVPRFPKKKPRPRNYFNFLIKEKNPEEDYLNQRTISHIYQIIEYLGRDINVRQIGLFRKTGSLVRQRELKSLLKNGENIDFDSGLYSVHDCACVLKSFLAEMPEPLLLGAHYSAHCQIAGLTSDTTRMSPSELNAVIEKQLKSTKLLLLLLPPDNYCLLKYLLLLLYQIQNSQEKNKMCSENLATMFAPHIMCPRKMPPEQFQVSYRRFVRCVTFLIENAPVLFEPPKELVQDIMIYFKETCFEGQIQAVNKEDEPVKTLITFCDRTKVPDAQCSDYTSQALSELQNYIESLPNTNRKRKLIKKLQKDNATETTTGEPGRKHFRSRSVGDAIKKHLGKSSFKRRDEANFCQSTLDVNIPASKSTDSLSSQAKKAASMEALYLEDNKESSRFAELRKNFLRSSREKVQKFKSC